MYVILTPGNSFVGLGSIAGACSSLFLCVRPSPARFGFETAFTLWSVGGQARGATPHRGAAAGAGADGAAGVCWAGVAARPGRDGGERGPGKNKLVGRILLGLWHNLVRVYRSLPGTPVYACGACLVCHVLSADLSSVLGVPVRFPFASRFAVLRPSKPAISRCIPTLVAAQGLQHRDTYLHRCFVAPVDYSLNLNSHHLFMLGATAIRKDSRLSRSPTHCCVMRPPFPRLETLFLVHPGGMHATDHATTWFPGCRRCCSSERGRSRRRRCS